MNPTTPASHWSTGTDVCAIGTERIDRMNEAPPVSSPLSAVGLSSQAEDRLYVGIADQQGGYTHE